MDLLYSKIYWWGMFYMIPRFFSLFRFGVWWMSAVLSSTKCACESPCRNTHSRNLWIQAIAPIVFNHEVYTALIIIWYDTMITIVFWNDLASVRGQLHVPPFQLMLAFLFSLCNLCMGWTLWGDESDDNHSTTSKSDASGSSRCILGLQTLVNWRSLL